MDILYIQYGNPLVDTGFLEHNYLHKSIGAQMTLAIDSIYWSKIPLHGIDLAQFPIILVQNIVP